jgi:HAD superfamily hydrolase (TIGR01549 family)
MKSRCHHPGMRGQSPPAVMAIYETLGQMAVALFDLDNTLFDRAGTYRQWALEYVRNAGLAEADAEWLCEVDQDGSADRYSMWALAKSRFSLGESVDHLIETHKQGYRALMKPDNDVNGALQTLRDVGWRLGIVTNGSVTAQAEKVRRLGLSPLVDGVCISGEIGLQKPDPRIFREVLARCGCDEGTSGDIWMVGDSPSADIAGGRNLGFKTIWIRRGRIWEHNDGDFPNAVAQSIAESRSILLSSA